jgi:hypothetical protein
MHDRVSPGRHATVEPMGGRTLTRRGVLSILLVALVAAGMGWREATPETRAVGGAVSLPATVAAATDAVVRTRADVVTGSLAEQRSAKARARLGLFVVLSPALLMAVAIFYLHQLVPGLPAVLRRRRRTGLRAPPLLTFS